MSTETEEQLRTENAELKQSIQELENTSKMLVRRDMDLREAYDALKLLDKEKSEFVSIAAHQLRTPLTSVNFANQILRDSVSTNLDKHQLHALEATQISIDRMFDMIEDLLVIDALDYGNLTLTTGPVDIESLTSEILGEFNEQIKQKSLKIKKCFDTSPKKVQADSRRLKDSITNIVDNAVKYTPNGGSISVSTKYSDSDVSIIITDTGIGVDSDNTSKLFGKFSRFDNAKLVDANGSGLGLYICKKIIEKHGGNVVFEPNQPSGSSFTIILPL